MNHHDSIGASDRQNRAVSARGDCGSRLLTANDPSADPRQPHETPAPGRHGPALFDATVTRTADHEVPPCK